MKNLLNPYQKNSVEVTLRSFEEDLRQVQNWLSEKESMGILFSRQNHLSEKQSQAILQKIDAALSEISYLKMELGLEHERENTIDRIRGQMSIDWENLSEIQGNKLARYGEISQEAVSIIDSPVQFLANIALSIAFIADENPTTSEIQQTDL